MENICLIDGDSIIWLASYTYKGQEVKSLKGVMECCDDYMRNILKACNSEYYSAFLTDGSFRYSYATIKPYKGNRVKMEKPQFFNTIRGYLNDHYGFQYIKNYEADDLCIMAHNTFSTNKEYNPIIASPDKDLKQIAGVFYDYKKRILEEVTEEQANRNLWMQMLTGDTGDNIPGLPNIGASKAPKILGDTNYQEKVLVAYIEHYGEYDGILNFTENYRLLKMRTTLDGILYSPKIIKGSDVIKDSIEDLW